MGNKEMVMISDEFRSMFKDAAVEVIRVADGLRIVVIQTSGGFAVEVCIMEDNTIVGVEYFPGGRY